MLADALAYPLRGDRALVRIAVGSLLVPLSFLGVPAFALGGYLRRVVGTSARGAVDPPSPDDPLGLVLPGVRAAVVVGAYALGLGVAGVVVVATVGPDRPGWLVPAVALAVVAGTYALAPAALGNAALRGRLAAAFEPRTLLPLLASPAYLVAGLASALLVVVAGAALVRLAALAPLAAAVLAPAAAAYLHLAVARACGTALRLTVPGEEGEFDDATASSPDSPAR